MLNFKTVFIIIGIIVYIILLYKYGKENKLVYTLIMAILVILLYGVSCSTSYINNTKTPLKGNSFTNIKRNDSIRTTFNYAKASWYGKPFHGRRTANGEVYNMYSYTAAHKTLKFGTKVKITNTDNNESVIVRINDRGPFIKGREFDLSYVVMLKLKGLEKGVINIKYTILK
jgi:rare lipoprotein A